MTDGPGIPDVPQWPKPGTTPSLLDTTLAGPAGDGSPNAAATGLTLRPVSVGQRLASGVIDVVLVVVAGIIYTIVLGSETPSGELAKKATFSMQFNDKQVTGGGIWLFQLLALGYFFLSELVIGGSVGKRLLGQRVVMADGSKLTVIGAVLRTLLRPIDGFPWILPNLLGFIVVAVNGQHRRIGDFVGGTMVISEK